MIANFFGILFFVELFISIILAMQTFTVEQIIFIDKIYFDNESSVKAPLGK